MEYTINKLAKMAGVSTRTLRFYDQKGLLRPASVNSSGYRIYGKEQTEMLQQIMFYRELGVSLGDIKNILDDPGFNKLGALSSHLNALKQRRTQLDALIENVEKTISFEKGEMTMSDKERFEGFKQGLIDENESRYGAEIREKYGNEAVDASNAKLKGMSKEQYADAERLSAEVNEAIKAAFEQGDPKGGLARKACALHKEWLMLYWDSYSKEAHMGLAQMYADDERFRAYYDAIAPDCAVFLRDAIAAFCG